MSRDELRQAGATMRATLGQPVGAAGGLGGPTSAPGFAAMMSEVVYGGIWARPGLAMDERLVCALAVVGLRAPSDQLPPLVRAALDQGLAARTVVEVFVHCGLYAGFLTTEAACAQARAVLAARGEVIPDDPPDDTSTAALDAAGNAVMQALHGARAGAGYAAPDDPVTSGLYALAIRYGYGALWSRPGLDHRQRLLCALAAFTALGLESQLVKFALAALDNGFDREQVVEAVIQTAPYSGFPRALNALGALSAAGIAAR
ncbi:MAG: carboxymuconolactone decarboxylase family protein [Ectothiorhodospiraceae bacterium]|nr:carboxymuconolactone decarboxylase family protein [Ectothiorhodospiraceae bacterium]